MFIASMPGRATPQLEDFLLPTFGTQSILNLLFFLFLNTNGNSKRGMYFWAMDAGKLWKMDYTGHSGWIISMVDSDFSFLFYSLIDRHLTAISPDIK